MPITISGTIAGLAVTGAASPVYTPTEDTSAGPNMRRWYITTVASANGAAAHSVSEPFYIELHRPGNFKAAPQYDPTGTRIVANGNNRNTYRLRVIKGVEAAANLPKIELLDMYIHVPAGSDVQDAPNVRVAMSLLGGFLNEDPVNLIETLITGLV